MPRAFDLGRPHLDKSPLDLRLDFENPQSILHEGARSAGGRIQAEAVAKPRLSFANLFRAWFGIGDDDPNQPFGLPDEMWTLGLSIRESYTEHTEAIVDLQDVKAAMNTTVAYVGDEQQMVSVPRCLLSVPTISGSNTPPKSRNVLDPVEFVYSGVYHFATMPVIRPGVVIGATQGDIIYTPIIADRPGRVEGVAWVGGGDTSIFSIDHYYLALCVYDPTTETIVKAWDAGDLKNSEAAQLNPRELYKAIDTEQECKPGQILLVAHQQIAPGGLQTARTIGAVPQANIARASGILVQGWCLRASGYSQGIPSSMPTTSLIWENRYVPWFGLRVSAIPDPEPEPEPEPEP